MELAVLQTTSRPLGIFYTWQFNMREYFMDARSSNFNATDHA